MSTTLRPVCKQSISDKKKTTEGNGNFWVAINLSMVEMKRKYLQGGSRRAFSESVVESGMHQLKLNRLYVFSLSSCCLQWNVRMFANTSLGSERSCLVTGGFDHSFQFPLVKCSDQDEQDEWAFYQIELELHKLTVTTKKKHVTEEHEALCQCVCNLIKSWVEELSASLNTL